MHNDSFLNRHVFYIDEDGKRRWRGRWFLLIAALLLCFQSWLIHSDWLS